MERIKERFKDYFNDRTMSYLNDLVIFATKPDTNFRVVTAVFQEIKHAYIYDNITEEQYNKLLEKLL